MLTICANHMILVYFFRIFFNSRNHQEDGQLKLFFSEKKIIITVLVKIKYKSIMLHYIIMNL